MASTLRHQSLISTCQTVSNPARSKPRSNPPIPANRLPTVGLRSVGILVIPIPIPAQRRLPGDHRLLPYAAEALYIDPVAPAARLLLLLLLTPAVASAFPRTSYRAADGTWVRKPHTYRRHPNAGTVTTALCRDGSTSYAHSRRGACSRHGGVSAWR